jgi:hypothetical protein
MDVIIATEARLLADKTPSSVHGAGTTLKCVPLLRSVVLPLNPLCVTVMSVLLFIFFSPFYGFSRFWSF